MYTHFEDMILRKFAVEDKLTSRKLCQPDLTYAGRFGHLVKVKTLQLQFEAFEQLQNSNSLFSPVLQQ